MWKTISSEVLFNHPRLTILEDLVELPNGQTTKYLKFDESASACTIIALKDNQILLQKEYSYPTSESLYQFPGGVVPVGEDLEKGANRELMEEASLKAGKLTLLGNYFVNNRRSSAKMYVYLATDLIEQSLDPDPEESLESYWLSEKKIEEMIRGGEVQNVHALASWALYKAR